MTEERWYGLEHWDRMEPSVEEAVQQHYRDVHESFDDPVDTVGIVRWPLVLTVFKRDTVPAAYADRMCLRMLDSLLDDLDSEYITETDESTKPSEIMKAAARTFMKVILAEYKVTTLVSTGETVSVSKADAMEMVE